MDRHDWTYDGTDFYAEAVLGKPRLFEGFGTTSAPRPARSLALEATAAEILHLARRVEDLEAEDVATAEGQEIIGELSAALAVLAGESLKPCTEPCPGHLGPKATEAVKAALAAWHALQEGNRAAAERIKALEREREQWKDGALGERDLGAELLAALQEAGLAHTKLTENVRALKARVAELEAHENATRKQLRIECAELGDNDWPDDLHLADVVEKHLARPAAARIDELEEERDDARGAKERLEGENRNLESRNRELLALIAQQKEDSSRFAEAGRTIRDLEEESRRLRESERSWREAAEYHSADVKRLLAPEPTRYSPAVPMDRLREEQGRVSAAMRAYLDFQPRLSRPGADVATFKGEPLTPDGVDALFPERYGKPPGPCTHPCHTYRGLECPQCGEGLEHDEPVARPADGEKIPCQGPPPAVVEGAESVFAVTARDPADQPLADVVAAILSRYRPTPEEDERIANTLAASVLDGRPLEAEDLDDPERDPFDRELERLRRRATRLDALLASEEVPEGLLATLDGHLPEEDRINGGMAARLCWDWFREQFGDEKVRVVARDPEERPLAEMAEKILNRDPGAPEMWEKWRAASEASEVYRLRRAINTAQRELRTWVSEQPIRPGFPGAMDRLLTIADALLAALDSPADQVVADLFADMVDRSRAWRAADAAEDRATAEAVFGPEVAEALDGGQATRTALDVAKKLRDIAKALGDTEPYDTHTAERRLAREIEDGTLWTVKPGQYTPGVAAKEDEYR
jgi:hypothetical protein